MITEEGEIHVQKRPKKRHAERIDSRDPRRPRQAENWPDPRAGQTGAVAGLGFFHLSQGLAFPNRAWRRHPVYIKRSPAKTGLRKVLCIRKTNNHPPFSPLGVVHPADVRHNRRGWVCT